MLKSLRTRLILSHFLPVLVLVPLLSLVLLYLLETQYILGDVATELGVQGELVAQMTQYEWQSWRDPERATVMMRRLQVQIPAQIILLDREGNVLIASTARADQVSFQQSSTEPAGIEQRNANVEASIDRELIQTALTGHATHQIQYRPGMSRQLIHVAVPVIDPEASDPGDQVIGVVQLNHSLNMFADRLAFLRWFVLGTFAAGALLAAVASFFLARSLNRPLLQLTEAARNFRFDEPPQPVPESGPEEVQTLAATFNAMASRLYDLEQSRQRLLRSVVHELGRPLGAIKAAAHVLRQGAATSDGETKELAAGINDQVDQLKLLVDDLTLLAQSETRELTLERQAVDIGELVETECQRNAHKMAGKGIELACDYEPDLPAVQGDPGRLSQILGNLLDNAYKYTPAGGQVRVSAQAESVANGDSQVVVQVGDTGPGIAPEEQERIFEFFYRGNDQDQGRQGMGIGLALARRLADAHGGSLTVRSQPGKGATFRLRLPATSSSPQIAAADQ